MTEKNNPNANYAMYESDRVAKRNAQMVTGLGNAPSDGKGRRVIPAALVATIGRCLIEIPLSAIPEIVRFLNQHAEAA